jgi:peptidoglycan hydrolase-like protein with peptidoglycan-binding domain
MRSPSRPLVLAALIALVVPACSLFESSEGIDVEAAQEQFCADLSDYIDSIDAYGGLFQDVELTVGDVKTAADELATGRETVENSAEQFRTAVEADPGSGVTIDVVEPESIEAVQEAEEAFAAASDIEDRTPLVDAGVEFSSAAYQLEVAWIRLFADAGCLDEDMQARAEAQQFVSEYVSGIQSDLATLGYYTGSIDGIYGPLTIQAVMTFQEDHDLPVTGLLDPPTQAVLADQLGTQTSAQVGALQAILISTGHYSGPVDGVWSEAVEESLIDFQEELGVPATGVVDAATLRAFEQALQEAGQEPEFPTTTAGGPRPTVPADTTTTTAPDDTTTTSPEEETTLLDVLEESGQFEAFLDAVETAGLEDMLAGPGLITVFVPTDDAIEAADLPGGANALADILLYHFIDDAYGAFDMVEAETLTTEQGADITVTVVDGLITLNESATATITNITASNGVAHVVNEVLAIPVD